MEALLPGMPTRDYAEPAWRDHGEERLRTLLADDFPPPLPAWAAERRPPNIQPWSHLSKVIDRL